MGHKYDLKFCDIIFCTNANKSSPGSQDVLNHTYDWEQINDFTIQKEFRRHWISLSERTNAQALALKQSVLAPLVVTANMEHASYARPRRLPTRKEVLSDGFLGGPYVGPSPQDIHVLPSVDRAIDFVRSAAQRSPGKFLTC